MKKNKGFTLIEVLIVLVIIALLTVGALTVLNTYRGAASQDEQGRNNAKIAYGLVQECAQRANGSFVGCEGSVGTYATAVPTWTATEYCFYSSMTSRFMVVSETRPNGVIASTAPSGAVNNGACGT